MRVRVYVCGCGVRSSAGNIRAQLRTQSEVKFIHGAKRGTPLSTHSTHTCNTQSLPPSLTVSMCCVSSLDVLCV